MNALIIQSCVDCPLAQLLMCTGGDYIPVCYHPDRNAQTGRRNIGNIGDGILDDEIHENCPLKRESLQLKLAIEHDELYKVMTTPVKPSDEPDENK